jgi:predicted porin
LKERVASSLTGGSLHEHHRISNAENHADYRANPEPRVGAGFFVDEPPDTSADQWVYGAGGTYNWDAWTVGLGWTHGDYEKAIGANGVGPFNADHDIYSATASYALGPGIQVDGVLEYSDYHSRNAAGPDYQGVGAGLGTLITF